MTNEQVIKSVTRDRERNGGLETCDMCMNDACSNCRVAYHHGVSCEVFNLKSDADIQVHVKAFNSLFISYFCVTFL